MKRIRTLACALLVAAATALPAAAQTPAPTTAATEAQYNDAVREVRQALEAWRLAWELGDFKSYQSIYDPAFMGAESSRKEWEQQRRSRLARKDIAVKIEKLEARLVNDSEMEVRFIQHYSAGRRSDTGEKRMTLKRVKGAWLITQETWKAT